MTDVVARAKAASEGVSDAPWEVELEDGRPIEHQHYQYDSTDEWYDVDGPNGGWLAHCQDIPNARFIAASRPLVPELAAEVEQLRLDRLALIEQADWASSEAVRLRETLQQVREMATKYTPSPDVVQDIAELISTAVADQEAEKP